MAAVADPSCWCIVVANGARARFFALMPARRHHPPLELLIEERCDLVQSRLRTASSVAMSGGNDTRRAASGGAGRNDDASEANWRREQERRFAAQIAEQAAACCRQWRATDVVLVADKRSLGLLRQRRDRLNGLVVHELSRDLSNLAVPALYQHLQAAGLLPHPQAVLRHRYPAPVMAAGKGARLDHGHPHPQAGEVPSTSGGSAA